MVGWIRRKTKEKQTIYERSSIIKKFLRRPSLSPLRLAFFDIDFTLSSNTAFLPKIRKSLEKQGYATIFVTARTEEMVMSSNLYEKSIHSGFYRPRPYLLKKSERYEYIDPKKINKFLVDPDIIIGSTGTQILVKQTSGVYKKDVEYENRLTKDSKNWRKKVLRLLEEIDPQQQHFTFSPIEDVANYYTGKTNVFPPTLRIQLFFPSFTKKEWFLDQLKQRKLLRTLTRQNSTSFIRVIDESVEEKGKYSIYLTPGKGNKGNAVEYVVKQLVKAVLVRKGTVFGKSQVETILAGDSYSDLGMLLHSALGTESTALLVGGSEVGKMLTNSETSHLATDDVVRLRSRLSPSPKKGYFIYDVPSEIYEEHVSRTLIIGDRAYPNTQGSETIFAYLCAMQDKEKLQLFDRLHKMVSSIRIYLPVPIPGR